jgi:hypothetical protein
MNQKVAVILVNWNSLQYTIDCIESLDLVTYRNFDIIVVDNGSTDGSAEKLKEKFNHIILLQSELNLGFTGGNNLALRYAIQHEYPYSMLLNNDTFVDPDFLEVLVNFMDNHPDTGIIQPKIYFHHNRSLLWNAGSYYQSWLGRTFTSGYNKISSPDSEKMKEVEWVTGCAFFTRNSILKECGLLAENLFIYFEDVDLSFRIRSAGYTLIYHPASVIYHIAGASSKKMVPGKDGSLNSSVHYYNVRNRIWILKKYTPLIKAPTVGLYTLFYLSGMIVYFTARFRFNKLRAVLKAIKDGIFDSIDYDSANIKTDTF